MRLSPITLFTAGVCLVALPTIARADEFTITGTNTITFSLPASPTPVSSTKNEGFIVDNVEVMLNGKQMNEDVLFFEDGIIIGDNPSITKDSTDIFYTFSATNQIANDFTTIPVNSFIGYESSLIFSGGESSPTFITGDYELQDNNNNGDLNLSITAGTIAATPEPSTLALFGTGVLGLAGIARRRFFNA